MIPIKTSVEDMQRVLVYMSKQIGWVEQTKVEKALGALDDRKVGAMVGLGLLQRDGSNLKLAPRGQTFASGDERAALIGAIDEMELYRATVEWMHYQRKVEVTAAEIGQYWEASHKDTLGSLKGTTLKDGAVTFGRVADGAGLGTFTVGRGGKETRLSVSPDAVAAFVEGPSTPAVEADEPVHAPEDPPTTDASGTVTAEVEPPVLPSRAATGANPSLSVTTSPSVHVNVEIHIAANATADTVKEIFRNMARYVLDKNVDDDGE